MDDMPDRAVTIGAHLSPEEENEPIQFLNKNKDVFAWSAKDLQVVDRDIIEHTLETDEKITLNVGDSPRGPLKRRGNPRLKPAAKPKHAKPNHAGA
jgi:hypothetical protein